MPYEYNPLLKDGFQKKSPVSPSDIQQLQSEISELQDSSESLNLKKVTKFFSANDYLEDYEIAQYQGEDDAVNNLQNGFFYKKNPAFTITQNADIFNYDVDRRIDWLLVDNTLKVSQYYLGEVSTSILEFFRRSDTRQGISLLFFATSFAVSSALKPSDESGFYYYPYAIVDGSFDFDNYVILQGSNYYYKGQIINFNNRSGGSDGILCASMTSPYLRYLWLPVLWSPKLLYAAFVFSTDSSNNFLLIGVDSKLSAFDLCQKREVSIDYTTINVQGVTLSANTPFQRVNTQPSLQWSNVDTVSSEARFINIDSLSGLENIKFSYNATNDYYITYDNLIARQGTPDIKYLDYVTINSLGAIYTHGQFLLANKTVDDYQYNGSVYGVQWDTSNPSPEVTRIGNLSLHATLPVHTKIVGGLMTDDGNFTPFANQSDWTNETRDGSLGQVMVKIPEFWIKFITEGSIYKVLMSDVPVLGFLKTSDLFGSAYEASLDRENLKLASVVNNSVNYRGGNNQSSWDGTYRTLLGRPVTNINLTNFRTYARNRNSINGEPDTRWNCNLYELQRLLYWLFVVEYATLNTQKPYNAELTSEGFRQGGLGNGVSEWADYAWNNFNSYNPFVPCGFTDDLGNQTGIKTYNVVDSNNNLLYAASVPRYRGFELPFSHIWKWTDGILVEVAALGNSAVFTTDDCSKFSSTDISNYNFIGNQVRSENFIKGIIFGNHGDIIANQFAGNSATYYCDYYYGRNIPSSGVSLQGCFFGGRALHGARCGLVYGDTGSVPDYASAFVGSRLCFKA